MGFSVQALEGAAALIYFLIFPHLVNRRILVPLAIIFTSFSLAFIPFVRFVAEQLWRERFVLCNSIAAGIVTCVCCALDRGIDSPLAYLLVLPIAYAAIALPVRFVALVSFLGLGELSWLIGTDPHITSSDSNLAIQAAALLGIAIIAITASMARQRLQTAEEASRSELARLAETDATSGCLNARGFRTRLDSEVDRAVRYQEPLTLLIADIDFFKYYNDTYGHANGDSVLTQLGELLHAVFRASDVIGRIGGDEFAILLVSTGLEQAGQAANRLCTAVRGMPGVPVTVSVGVSSLRDDRPTVKNLFEDADVALYRAKSTGRDRVVLTTEPQQERTHQRSSRLISEDRDRVENRLMQATRQNRETLALLEALESSAPMGICVTDTDYRVMRMNRAMVDLVGERRAHWTGVHLKEALPAIWPKFESLALCDAASGEMPLGTLEVTLPDGRTRFLFCNAYPIELDGHLSAMAIVAVDVTERHEVEESQKRLLHMMIDTISVVVESRDPYTAGHLRRVADLSSAIAKKMGLPDIEIDGINLAARIHDIGKVRIPAELLVRPGSLSSEELALVKQHAQVGYEILMEVGCPVRICEAVLQHHERLDGSGYPGHLKGDAISVAARVIAVADVVDAMQTNRPYREAPGLRAALAELAAGAGSRYDPDVVLVCLDLLASSEGSTGPGDLLPSVHTNHSREGVSTSRRR